MRPIHKVLWTSRRLSFNQMVRETTKQSRLLSGQTSWKKHDLTQLSIVANSQESRTCKHITFRRLENPGSKLYCTVPMYNNGGFTCRLVCARLSAEQRVLSRHWHIALQHRTSRVSSKHRPSCDTAYASSQ